MILEESVLVSNGGGESMTLGAWLLVSPGGGESMNMKARPAVSHGGGESVILEAQLQVSHKKNHRRGGGVLDRRYVLDLMHDRSRMNIDRRDGACRVFTDQADITCTKCGAP